MRKLPTFLGRLSELQDFFATSVDGGASALAREARLPILASLLRSIAGEVRHEIAAACRGNADGSLKRAVEAEIAAMILSLESYLEALNVGTLGIDARDTVAHSRLHESTVRQTIRTWTVVHRELDRLLQRRIDGLRGRMGLSLILIGARWGASKSRFNSSRTGSCPACSRAGCSCSKSS